MSRFSLDEEKEKTKYKEKNQATTLSQGRKKCQNTTASPEQLLEERKKTTMQLVIDNFFIWYHLCMKNYVWISHIWNLNFSNDLGWRNAQNESCRSRRVIQLCSWQIFYLKSSMHGKLRLNFSHMKFEFFKRARMKKQQKRKLCNFIVDDFFI